MLEHKLDQDIKSAMLAKDVHRTTTLRGLKSNLLDAKVAGNKREVGLTDDEVIAIFAKEAKKRQETADIYLSAGDQARADQELSEKAMIEEYLPKPISEKEISRVIDEVIAKLAVNSLSQMGQVIGQVKQKLGPAADGSLIAKLTKEKLE
jgi:hypothetical protein